MDRKFLDTGKIVSTHGVHGEVKVLPWADSPEFLLQFDTFYMDGKPVQVQSSRVHKTCVLVKLRGVDTVEQASLLRGKVLQISRQDPHLSPDVVFIADLIGLPVLADGQQIGRITEVLTMPSSDVYVVKGTHTYMIPAVKAFVPEIDPSRGCIEVNLIEGMRTDAD